MGRFSLGVRAPTPTDIISKSQYVVVVVRCIFIDAAANGKNARKCDHQRRPGQFGFVCLPAFQIERNLKIIIYFVCRRRRRCCRDRLNVCGVAAHADAPLAAQMKISTADRFVHEWGVCVCVWHNVVAGDALWEPNIIYSYARYDPTRSLRWFSILLISIDHDRAYIFYAIFDFSNFKNTKLRICVDWKQAIVSVVLKHRLRISVYLFWCQCASDDSKPKRK